MTFNGGCKPFNVLYCDGQSETNLGVVMVFPTTNIERILPILSDKIGIPEHQLSVFIADKNSSRKFPFPASLTISSVTHHPGAYYFSVKRHRRWIKNCPLKNKNLSEKLVHQPRDGAVDGMECNCFWQSCMAAPWILEDYENQVRMEILGMNREALLMSMGYTVNDSLSRRVAVGNGGGCRVAECKECIMSHMSRTVADFHLCAHDEVIVGFRTLAGPICPPVRNAGENGN